MNITASNDHGSRNRSNVRDTMVLLKVSTTTKGNACVIQKDTALQNRIMRNRTLISSTCLCLCGYQAEC